MPTLDQWVTDSSDPKILAHYIDTFIIGLIKRVGLKVKVRRTQATTTLTIYLRRAEQTR